MGEHTADLDLACFGGAIGLLALDAFEIFRASRDAGHVSLNGKDFDWGRALVVGPVAHPFIRPFGPGLNDALNLSAGNIQSGKAAERFRGEFERSIHSAGPAHQLRYGRRVLSLETKGFVEGITAPLWSAIILAAKRDGTDNGAQGASLVGVELFARFELGRSEELGDFGVEEPLDHPGQIAHGGISKRALDPSHVQLAGVLYLFADQGERGFCFAETRLLDGVVFFLAS